MPIFSRCKKELEQGRIGFSRGRGGGDFQNILKVLSTNF